MSDRTSRSELATLAIHGGLAPDPATGAILTPIYQSTTFVQEAVGQHKGYTYTRSGNPTVSALEANLGSIEDALPAVSFSTGMAAITGCFLAFLQQGDHVVVSDVVYGGTVRLLRQVLARFGVSASFVDTADALQVARAITPRTRLVFVETPANPTLKLTDLAAVAAVCKQAGVLFVVDNTFLTPALQRPLDLGADLVLYSTTKFLEGHNTTVGGSITTRDPELRERLRFLQNAIGFPQTPFESWLTLRGIKTLPLRMERHSQSALAVAEFLESHPRVERVAYPWLPSFPQHELAQRQQSAGGGVLAFEVVGGVNAAVAVMNAVELCSLAENLGAVETLITHPATMTHADVPADDRRRAGLADGLIRLSVGLEDPADLLRDLDQALEASGRVN